MELISFQYHKVRFHQIKSFEIIFFKDILKFNVCIISIFKCPQVSRRFWFKSSKFHLTLVRGDSLAWVRWLISRIPDKCNSSWRWADTPGGSPSWTWPRSTGCSRRWGGCRQCHGSPADPRWPSEPWGARGPGPSPSGSWRRCREGQRADQLLLHPSAIPLLDNK